VSLFCFEYRVVLTRLAGVHDAFKLYGRPTQYSFNPHNPASLMFAYPIDPSIDVSILVGVGCSI
jgi:CCR4-NOT transcriptional complex subunit CAF120